MPKKMRFLYIFITLLVVVPACGQLPIPEIEEPAKAPTLIELAKPAPDCTLLAFIDDATGRLGELRFVQRESFFSYAESSRAYFERCGKPVAFYSDKHGIFRVNQPSVSKGEALTQFGRAMQELNVQIICANTPQAKGRVERAYQTMQDRLVKEMRLRDISNIADGNAYLPEFMQDFNSRFAVIPRSQHDAHRLLLPQDDLNQILTWQEIRILSKNLTLQFRKIVYQIQTSALLTLYAKLR